MRQCSILAFILMSISGGGRGEKTIRVETTRGHRDCVPPTGVGWWSGAGVYL